VKKIKKRGIEFLGYIQSLLAKKRVLVLGDSHAEVFKDLSFILSFPNLYFDVVAVGGATASGLKNPRSKTKAYAIFKEALNIKRYDKIVLLLGEVDTGFVIWYRAKKYQSSIQEMLDRAVETYTKFIDYSLNFKDVIVISTPLPTIDDNSKGEVANARRELNSTQKERTDLTLEFNRRVKAFCDLKGVSYISLDSVSLGNDGLVKRYLKNPNPLDHHYNKRVYAKLIIEYLKPLI